MAALRHVLLYNHEYEIYKSHHRRVSNFFILFSDHFEFDFIDRSRMLRLCLFIYPTRYNQLKIKKKINNIYWNINGIPNLDDLIKKEHLCLFANIVRGDRDSRANLMPIYGDLYQIKL